MQFLLAKLVLEKYFRQDGSQKPEVTAEHKFNNEVQAWLFPQVLKIAKVWYSQYVYCKDNTFPELLLLIEHAHRCRRQNLSGDCGLDGGRRAAGADTAGMGPDRLDAGCGLRHDA